MIRIKSDGAADAAIVHLKDFFIRIDHQLVITHPELTSQLPPPSVVRG